MPTLYVSEPGAQVRRTDERLVVTKDKQVLQEIPMIKVDQVVLVGRGVSLTTATLHALSQRGVGVLYLSGGGKFISRMEGPEHKHSRLRFAQALFVSDPGRALEVARSMVHAKLANQRAVIRRAAAQGAPLEANSFANFETARSQASSVPNHEILRGYEGSAARAYFEVFRRLLRPPADGQEWGFICREYYPPPDPINALLSFGYTLLLNDVTTACQLIGLDPYLGVLHTIDYGRPSMALDLEEEFRPVIVDSLVLEAVNRRMFQPSDFEMRGDESEDLLDEEEKRAPRGIYLKSEARAKFIRLYEERVIQPMMHPSLGEQTSFRRVFQLQAQGLARLILGEIPAYPAYVLPG